MVASSKKKPDYKKKVKWPAKRRKAFSKKRSPPDPRVAIKEELVRLTKNVREKFRGLRRDSENVERQIEASVRPLVTPIQKTVAESIKSSIPKPMIEPIKKEIKKETKSTGSDLSLMGSDEEEGLNRTTDAIVQTEGDLAERYLRLLSNQQSLKTVDSTYGPRVDGKGNILIGDSIVHVTKNALIINNDKRFAITHGLMELVFKKLPDKDLIEVQDVKNYKELLLLTNAHRQMYSGEKPINATRGKKYTGVISQLFPASGKPDQSPSTLAGSSSGRGFGRRYSNNVNSLVDRLMLLTLSKRAGHTGHDREINNIIMLLKENHVIA